MRVADLTWMHVEAYLEEDDLCVLPLGVPVFPAVPYGITPYFMAYPGTVTVSPTTYERLLTEVLGSLRRHGFRRIAIVNGHGGNTPARPAAEAWARRRKGVTLRWHDWWKAPRTRAAIDAIDPEASHAS